MLSFLLSLGVWDWFIAGGILLVLEILAPGVFMLWPNNKPGKEPALAAQAKNHWVLQSKCALVVKGKATGASIGIGLTLVGHSPAE